MPDAEYQAYYNEVEAIARMLTKLIVSVDALRNELRPTDGSHENIA